MPYDLFWMRRSQCLLVAAVLALLAISTQAATRTWNGGAGQWSSSANWTPAGVPEADDEVVIEAGSLQLDGLVTISRRLTWTGGTLQSGTLRLAPGATAELGGTDDKLIQNLALANAGELRITGGRLGCLFTGYSQAVSITNEARATMTLADGAAFEQRNAGNWPPAQLVFVNAGLLRSQGSATNRIQDIPLDNQGVVEVQEGRLLHRGGGQSSGGWAVAANAVSEWQTGHYTLTEAQIAGPGPTLLNGAFTLQGAWTADWFELQSGSINGSAEIRDGFRWTGGSLSGAQLRLGPGEHRMTGDAGQTMQNVVLVNAGHLVADGAVVSMLFNGYNQFVLLTNEVGGVLELRDGARLRQANSGGWSPAGLLLANRGTLRSSGAATNCLESLPLNNSGTLEITEGALCQSGGGVSPGQVQIAASARHEIGGGTYNLDGGQWTGAGAARIVATSRLLGAFRADNFGLAAGDLDGDFELTGGFQWTAGRLGGVRVRLGPGTHRISGETDKLMQMATIANAGHLVLEDCALGLQFTGYNQYAMLTNEVGGVLEFAGTARLEQRNGGGWAPANIGLFNDGTFRVSGVGLKNLTSVPLYNRGQLEILEGTLQHTGGGTSPGRFAIAANGRLELSGGTYQLGGSQWSGPGPAAVVGDLTLLGDFLAENFRLERGTISAECRIGGGCHWTGGSLVGSHLRLGPGEHRIAGPDSKTLLHASIVNAGHLVFEEATVGLQFTGYSQIALVLNEAGGQLDLLGGARIEQRNGGGWTPAQIGLVNAGVLRKREAETATLAGVPLVNRGLCEATDGVLRVESNATFEEAGQFTVRLGNEPAVQVTGTATLAGRIEADTPPGFQVVTGATFTPITAGALSGQFANPITLNPGHVYQYVNAYAGKSLTLTAESGLVQPVQLLSVRLADGQFQFDVQGQTGLIYLVESSPDLVQWQLDQRLTAAADVTTVQSSILGQTARSFRVSLLP